MSFSLILTGILTGAIAALYTLSLGNTVIWAMAAYAIAGALSAICVGFLSALPRRTELAHNSRWKRRLDRMTEQ